MIALGVLLTGLGFAGSASSSSGLGMALAVAVWSFGEMFGSASAAAFVADRAPTHLRGRYQSALGIMYGSAFTIGPLGGTAIYGWSPTGVWIACAALGLIGAALALAGAAVPGPPSPRTPAGLTLASSWSYISNRYTGPIYRLATDLRKDHRTCSNSRSWAS